MSPRRNRSRGQEKQQRQDRRAEDDAPRYGLEHTVEWRGEEWVVRGMAADAAAKRYRCPGCDQEIPPGVPHAVAWPRHGDVADRRHWHHACWNARDRRSARLSRPRGGGALGPTRRWR
ncbi:ATP/GTP-binding protein [Streptomyces sp. 4N509B]|uniref:ATP/GTP-binding protein n=1 Tax=Streptomyces sp. 4N509B TaxID=3457413 RepID=UPI003FD5BB77